MNIYQSTYALITLLHTLLFFLPCRATQMTYECKDDSSDTFFDNTGCLGEQNAEKPENPFLNAAKQGNLEELKKLEGLGYNINITDQDGKTALHLAIDSRVPLEVLFWLVYEVEGSGNSSQKNDLSSPFLLAAKQGYLGALCLLYPKVANLHVTDQDRNNALHLAAMYVPDSQVITWLIDTVKLPIESKNQWEETPFLCAAEKGNLSALKILKEKGANLNATDQDGNNALHDAALYASEVKGIAWLIDTAQIDIESKGNYQKTAFLFAAEKGNLLALKVLQKKGANLNYTDQDGDNALHYAALYAPEGKGIPWLIDTADINIESKGNRQQTAFLCAASNGNLPALKVLKAKGANVNATDQDGDNALHYAALYEAEGKGIAWLLDIAKIDIDSKGYYQKTAFLCAAEKGNLDALKILQKKGANLNATDQDGYNALHYAALYAPEGKGITWLIDTAHLSTEIKNNKNKTAFLCAAEKGNLSALKILQKKGANLGATDQGGNNALHYAALYAPEGKGIAWLIDTAEMNIESKGNDQKTAFLCGAEKGNLSALKILKEKGANINVKDQNDDNALALAKKNSADQATIDWLEKQFNVKEKKSIFSFF